MIYFLAKFSVVFLLACLFGVVIGHWWANRRSDQGEEIRNVSDKITEDRIQLSLRLDSLDDRMNSLLDTDVPEETDLTSINDGLARLRTDLADLPDPTGLIIDGFGDVRRKLDELVRFTKGIPVPIPQPAPDFSPLYEQLGGLDLRMQPLHQKIADIGVAVEEIRRAGQAQPRKIEPIAGQLKSIEARLLETPTTDPADIESIAERLTLIETNIEAISERLAVGTWEGPKPAQEAFGTMKLLNAELFGERDDLTKISGIGPSLERLLNDNGVYYYWQVASWTQDDIGKIDERLDTFRGRIERDNWVVQARRLEKTPDASRAPEGSA